MKIDNQIQQTIFEKMDREICLLAKLGELLPAFQLHHAHSDLSMLLNENF